MTNPSMTNPIWKSTCANPDALRKVKLQFAKVNIFNPQVYTDQLADCKLWLSGKPANLNPFYELDQFHHTQPVTVAHYKRRLVNWEGHKRSSGRFFYKSFIIEEKMSPIKASAHAIARYRERNGRDMKPELLWENVVPHPSSLMKAEEGWDQRNDCLQPTENGAWLGVACARKEQGCLWEYSRKKGLRFSPTGEWQRGFFIAHTWIHRNDMHPFQVDAWEAHREGDHKTAQEIMSKNLNTSQIIHHEKVLFDKSA
jgi:hypothetical protein